MSPEKPFCPISKYQFHPPSPAGKHSIPYIQAFRSVFPSMFARGSFNNWGAQRMYLVDDYTWQVAVSFVAGNEFKFDVFSDWSTNYGDNGFDGKCDWFGANIPIRKDGCHKILFNDQALQYTILLLTPGQKCPDNLYEPESGKYYVGYYKTNLNSSNETGEQRNRNEGRKREN